jgi:hypothetical protein
MTRQSRHFVVGLVALASLSACAGEQTTQTFSGVIADSECENGDHSGMRMGPTDADCVMACVNSHGAQFVLWDGARTLALSDQQAPREFAGRQVTVSGTLDGSTIQVQSIAARQ